MIATNLWAKTVLICTLSALVSCESDSEGERASNDETASDSSLEQIAKLEGEVTFTLEDGEALNRKYPDTFWIPARQERESLVADDLVKLVFNLTDGNQTQGERMWVLVTGGDGKHYTGTLDNDPYCTDKIKAGLEVEFEPRHVIEIYEAEVPESKNAEQGVGGQPATTPRVGD